MTIKSIHTTVVGPARQRVELQIRTEHMHGVAEYGIAAHTSYKDGEDPLLESSAYETLRKTIEQLAEGDNPEEFLEHTKLELFLDQISAIAVLGVSSMVKSCQLSQNSKMVMKLISSGQKNKAHQQHGNLLLQRVRHGLLSGGQAGQAVRKQYSTLGVRILERAFDRAGKTYNSELLELALPRLARESLEDVLTEVGRNEMLAENVIMAIYPDYQAADGAKSDLTEAKSKDDVIPNRIPIRGINSDLPVQFSKDGGAVPGRQHCWYFGAGWDVDENNQERFPARIRVLVDNKPGILALVAESHCAKRRQHPKPLNESSSG
ncbi:GTP pyrophosphokinase rsh [Nymphon striatum]|nr:GTP pyrophosphokinase rsh [Nymphon striatum]